MASARKRAFGSFRAACEGSSPIGGPPGVLLYSPHRQRTCWLRETHVALDRVEGAGSALGCLGWYPATQAASQANELRVLTQGGSLEYFWSRCLSPLRFPAQ